MTYPPDTLDRLRPIVEKELNSNPQVRFAFLHGSAHEGLPFRDLDIAVWIESEDNLKASLLLAQQLETTTGVPCDVHLLNDAPNLFSYQASRGELLKGSDEEEISLWRERVWSDYFRYQPHRERLIADWLAV